MDSADEKHITLAGGNKMPTHGLGVWKIPDDQCADAVYNAIKAGYRLIDGAGVYNNEKGQGVGIKRAIDEGICKREDLFITSKLWNQFHRKEHVEIACKKSLELCGVDYFDLYLIHFPVALKYIDPAERWCPFMIHDYNAKPQQMIEEKVPYQETWEGMEDLVKKGLVKNIGVSNIGIQLLREVISYAKVPCAVNQIEIHPYLTNEAIVNFCQLNNVAVTAYSSFGAGSYIPMGMGEQYESCLEEQVMKDIAAAHTGKNVYHVSLRWAIQRGLAVIPKTTNQQRLVENAAVWDFKLTDEEMKKISALNKWRRFNNPSNYGELKENNIPCLVFEDQ